MANGRTHKQQIFIDSYLKNFNATQAALDAGYSEKCARSIGSEILTKPDIQNAIKQRLNDSAMTAEEVLSKLSEQGRSDIRVFFKIVEEWTFFPLPTYEIIDAKEVTDDTVDPPKTRVSYWVRHITIDLDRVMDPNYSHLINKFTDSPRNGLGLELYNKQSALQTLARVHGLIIDKKEISGPDGGAIPIEMFNSALTKVYGDDDSGNS